MLSEAVKVEPRMDAAMPDPASPWQLYDLRHDWSQTTDVAAAHPDKVAELKTLWEKEAARNHVLPLLYNNFSSMLPGTRPEPLSEPGVHVVYPAQERYPAGAFPAINNRGWTITADIDVPAGDGEGMLVTQGGHFSDWGLAVLDGKPVFFYRNSDRAEALVRVAAPEPLAPGRHMVTVSFTVDGPGFGRGGRPRAFGRWHDQEDFVRSRPCATDDESQMTGRRSRVSGSDQTIAIDY